LLTSDELAFLTKQEAAGKISLLLESFLHTSLHNNTASISHPLSNTQPAHGFVYTEQMHHNQTSPQPQILFIHTNPHQPSQNNPHQHPNQYHPSNTNNHTSFNLSIAIPKIDFPSFPGDDPLNWLRQCEKYFALATVLIDTWVPLATFYCQGSAHTWWRSLCTPANYVHWTQFCTLVTNIFSAHNTHASVEDFHHLRQTTSVYDYIHKFEEIMALMQMDYPGLTEPYFVSSSIARLKEGIKHYLIPHSPHNLGDTYSKALFNTS
jgi:hypothetical protein